MLDLPSVKLNIFKKLEYFLILEEFDTQFKLQFEVLKNDKDKKNYPTWEVEKKILFWSYMYHKFHEHWIKNTHLTPGTMFVSEQERNNTHPDIVFGNLMMKGFGEHDSEKGLRLNEKGMAFGNMLWYLYMIKKCDDSTPGQEYKKIYGADYILKKNFLGALIVYLQYFAVLTFMIFGVSIVVIEILASVNLLDNLILFVKEWFYYPVAFLFFFCLPVLSLIISFGLNFIYILAVVNKKNFSLEKMKQEMAIEGAD